VEVRVGDDYNLDLLATLDLCKMLTLLVEQERGDRDRKDGAHFGGPVLEGFFFNQAHDRQRQRFDAANSALALTAGADFITGFAQRRTKALAGHFHQAETRDLADLY